MTVRATLFPLSSPNPNAPTHQPKNWSGIARHPGQHRHPPRSAAASRSSTFFKLSGLGFLVFRDNLTVLPFLFRAGDASATRPDLKRRVPTRTAHIAEGMNVACTNPGVLHTGADRWCHRGTGLLARFQIAEQPIRSVVVMQEGRVVRQWTTCGPPVNGEVQNPRRLHGHVFKGRVC